MRGIEIVAAAAIARQRGPVRALDAAEIVTLRPPPFGREKAVKCFLVLRGCDTKEFSGGPRTDRPFAVLPGQACPEWPAAKNIEKLMARLEQDAAEG